jgi:hypothetical protein
VRTAANSATAVARAMGSSILKLVFMVVNSLCDLRSRNLAMVRDSSILRIGLISAMRPAGERRCGHLTGAQTTP